MKWIDKLEQLAIILPYALNKSKVDEVNSYRNAISEAIWSFKELQALYEDVSKQVEKGDKDEA